MKVAPLEVRPDEHNLCVLIQSQCELGIESVFWQDGPRKGPAILPMVRPG
jgi:hypothetical protein